jgi:hypothetical protein
MCTRAPLALYIIYSSTKRASRASIIYILYSILNYIYILYFLFLTYSKNIKLLRQAARPLAYTAKKYTIDLSIIIYNRIYSNLINY